MPIATLSSKGQITLPASLRKRLGFKPKDRLLIESNGDAIVIRRPVDFFALKGKFGTSNLTLRQVKGRMMEGAAEHVLGRDHEK